MKHTHAAIIIRQSEYLIYNNVINYHSPVGAAVVVVVGNVVVVVVVDGAGVDEAEDDSEVCVSVGGSVAGPDVFCENTLTGPNTSNDTIA